METVDRAKLSMNNHGTLESLSVTEAAKLICYLCRDCENCPVKARKTTWSIRVCRDTLEDWLQEPKNEDFWAYLLEGSEK
ncbi:MAG: hypothetical protein HFE75_15035 [Firmicutes bacterium]|jgi:hypothetical protein|nr:hypothetical protein [Bacillota bacterium]